MLHVTALLGVEEDVVKRNAMLESLGLRLALELTSQVDWRLDVQQILRHGQEKERLNVKTSHAVHIHSYIAT